MEEIYSSKKQTDITVEDQQLDSFLRKIISLAKEKRETVASMLIRTDDWAAKINEDNKRLHSTINMNLLRYLNGKNSSQDLDDENEDLVEKAEKMNMLLNDIRVSIVITENECQIAMLTMNRELNDYQVSFLESMIEKCKEYGEAYNCNMYLGYINQVISIDAEGLLVENGISDEKMEKRLIEIINSTKKKASEKHTI